MTMLGSAGLVWAQPVDPNHPMLRVDENKELKMRMFNAKSLDPKMSVYNQTSAPKLDSRFSKTIPVKEADNLSKGRSAEALGQRRWSGAAEETQVSMSRWDQQKSSLNRRAQIDGAGQEGPKAATGLSTRMEQPKVYLGPENPKARPEQEVIRNTLGSIQNVEELAQHQLSPSEIRKLLMTPERVRKAEAADQDSGITFDVAPRAIPVPKER
ncbi:MAG: hypothetical protein SNJ84_02025 [Verrucomicrobiia bacterium]